MDVGRSGGVSSESQGARQLASSTRRRALKSIASSRRQRFAGAALDHPWPRPRCVQL